MTREEFAIVGNPKGLLTVKTTKEQIGNSTVYCDSLSRRRGLVGRRQHRKEAIMFIPATQTDIDRYERAVDSAIATCGGDLRGALKALIVANEYLEEELRQVLDMVEAHGLLAMPKQDVA